MFLKVSALLIAFSSALDTVFEKFDLSGDGTISIEEHKIRSIE